MLSIVLTELQKIKRYHILLIGIIGMALSPILGLITQNVAIEEAKNPNFDLSALVDNTLKNVLVVPVSLHLFHPDLHKVPLSPKIYLHQFFSIRQHMFQPFYRMVINFKHYCFQFLFSHLMVYLFQSIKHMQIR